MQKFIGAKVSDVTDREALLQVRAAIDTTQTTVLRVQDERYKNLNESVKRIEVFQSPLIELNKELVEPSIKLLCKFPSL